MATVIRLKRGGRTHAPYYRVVVMDSRARTRGAEIDDLGVYHPCARPEPRIEIDARKALDWLRKGAKPSDTVRNVFSDKGLMKAYADGVKPEELEPPAEPAESVVPEAEAKAETAPAEPTAETPEAKAEEAPAESASESEDTTDQTEA